MNAKIIQQLRVIYNDLEGCWTRLFIGTGRDAGEESERMALSCLMRLRRLIELSNDIELKAMAYSVDNAVDDLTWDSIKDVLDKLDGMGIDF